MTSAYEVGRIPEITLVHRLKIARETAGLDQGQLAEMIGVSRNSISNAEAGRHTPRRILVNAWALATGVPVYWLETGKAPRPGNPGGGQLLPHLDSNQKPAGLQPRVSDLGIRRRIRARQVMPARRWQPSEVPSSVIYITVGAA